MSIKVTKTTMNEAKEVYGTWREELNRDKVRRSSKDSRGEWWFIYKEGYKEFPEDDIVLVNSPYVTMDEPYAVLYIEKSFANEDRYDCITANWSFGEKLINKLIEEPDSLIGFERFEKKEQLKQGGTIFQLNPRTGKAINKFESTKEASNYTHIKHQHIKEVLSGKRKSAGGFNWKYE